MFNSIYTNFSLIPDFIPKLQYYLEKHGVICRDEAFKIRVKIDFVPD